MTRGEPITEKPAGPAGTGPQEPPPPAGAVGYEPTDVRPRPLTKALAGLVAGTVIVVALLLPMFLWLRGRAERREPPPPPMGRRPAGRLPAEPRLQTTPVQDLDGLLAQERRRLSSYGWVDEPKGIVHIPIDAAMRIIAERGLPAAPAAGPSPAAAAPGAPAAAATPPASPAAAPSPGGHR